MRRALFFFMVIWVVCVSACAPTSYPEAQKKGKMKRVVSVVVVGTAITFTTFAFFTKEKEYQQHKIVRP